MASPNIKPAVRIHPMIYCYTTPGVEYHDGWSKIGYTDKQTVEDRVAQQTHTAGIKAKIEWKDLAQYKDITGEYFKDTQFHNYLTRRKSIEREPDTEWFRIEPKPAQDFFYDFATRADIAEVSAEQYEYELRDEQAEAVRVTKAYFEAGGSEFLWNAKPRFGKTLSTYDLVRQMGFRQVLVVTNRPSIANSWADDFYKFIGWRGELYFVSETDSIKDRKGVISRDDFLKVMREGPRDSKPGMVAFESLQGLKGSAYFGGVLDKLEWISSLKFDLLVVDESQEGVDTSKTDQAFRNIKRDHTLYLSGTPFKALADGRFKQEQIFNWSYADEQEAKATWSGDTYNVYEPLPELQMFTYQMSLAVEGELRQGAAIADDGENVDYTFDLNEFFATGDGENPGFKYKDDVAQFLDALTTQERYPFSTPELRAELPHTLWLLNRVNSAKALAKMLKQHPVFSEYEIVLAAGDGRLDDDDDFAKDREAKASFDKVKKAIAEHEKTITLSVGQLTVGVTVPEWSGVLMLSNMQSPSSYMQAAFRVQNPYEGTIAGSDGKPMRVRKERAYVFDFDPARTLIIFDEFANNLSSGTVGGGGTTEERKENIRKLLNFFPVLGEDEEGRMVEIDAQQVLSIPRRLKSAEVVRRGFMSNYLFQNIGGVFAAPAAVTKILDNITPVKQDNFDASKTREIMADIEVDSDGNINISNETVIGKSKDLFGPKIYETLAEAVDPALENITNTGEPSSIDVYVQELTQSLKESVESKVIDPAFEEYELKPSKKKQLVRESHAQIDREISRIKEDFDQQVRIAEVDRDRKLANAESSEAAEVAQQSYEHDIEQAFETFMTSAKSNVQTLLQTQPEEVTKKLETMKAEEKKRSSEDDIRSRLRGFARTIPSFIMAYGDEGLTLANFDDYTEDDVFKEVTGITEEQFRFLRDGGEIENPETGEIESYEGGLFDETVFNDSIQEFLKKRQELANYFDESNSEDIFDYISPQKTNQIFTPRWVVKKMVDALEEENPGCYDDPQTTFADLYMKSGLYITEIVKRLFASDGLKKAYPDADERIRHILTEQVYGAAPSRIIYLIATNYIFGFDESLKAGTSNFIEADTAGAAKDGTMTELVDKYWPKARGK